MSQQLETAALHAGHNTKQTHKTLTKVFESPYNGKIEKQVELFTWEKLDHISLIKKTLKL
jgi:S-adenosylmethionine synthetase